MPLTTLSLSGPWQFAKADTDDWLPAQIPGCVHSDLLREGHISDPYYRDHELQLQWIGEAAWLYRREFEVDPSYLKMSRVLLRCEGLDTFASIRVNDRDAGRADNMHRTWEFDVRDLLVPGTNRIEVRFDSVLPYIRERQAGERPMYAWNSAGGVALDGAAWVRKMPCNFGWDWAPMLVSCGIWREISLVAFHTARIADVQPVQHHHADGSVEIDAHIDLERLGGEKLTVSGELIAPDGTITRASAEVGADSAVLHFHVADPCLWWPNGMGAQPLHTLRVEAGDDARSLRIGLRRIELQREPDQWGETFQFAVNGVPFFAKGANWIPVDPFPAPYDDARHRHLLGSARDAHMNMLRVWGGGVYPDSRMFDLCDEMGLLVWQDFMFACSLYPAFDAAYMENVKAEARDNVRRLRHHASLALWCGNNELEQGLVAAEWTPTTMSWADYGLLFDHTLPEITAALDPATPYWPCSPHTPRGDRANFNDSRSGDAHLWTVWFSDAPFESYRTCKHRFNSEFGFQSFPERRTVEAYTEPADRNLTSRIMTHHQRSAPGNARIFQKMLDWFRVPRDFDSSLRLSQITQGLAIGMGVEHWRRSMPHGMGTLYWQINDCWPCASWSSIDSFGRWKALHYMARRFFAPLLVSGVEDKAAGTAEIHVTSDMLESRNIEVRWLLTDAAGKKRAGDSIIHSTAPRASACVATLDLREHLDALEPHNAILWLELLDAGRVVSDTIVWFARPRLFDWPSPRIESRIEQGAVRLTTDAPAPWTWLESPEHDLILSDNFFHLRPGVEKTLTFTPPDGIDFDSAARSLRVRSLRDTND